MIAALLGASRAHASAPSLAVADDVTGCPDAASLRASIVEGLGREPPDDATVRVEVRKKDDALYAEIVVERAGTPPRSRVVTGDACADLLRAAALVAVLALKQDEAPAPAPAPLPAEPPASKEAPAPPAPVVPLRAASAVVVASGMTSFALLPRPASGAALAARLRVTDAVWLSARGFHLPAVETQDEAFALGLSGAGAGACVEPFGGASWAANGCAHFMGGALSAADVATPLRDDRSQAFLGASLGASARGRLIGPLVLEGSIESMVPFRHPTFVTATCPGTGFQQPFATLALSLGVGVSIP